MFFVGPAVAMTGVMLWLTLEETGSLEAALRSGATLSIGVVALIFVIWGTVVTKRPIVVLSEKGLSLPNGVVIEWADISKIATGQDLTIVVSQNTGARTVKHETVRLTHVDGEETKVVLTWAAEGPTAAADRIRAAYESRADESRAEA